MNQQTFKEAFQIEGIGLHSGKPVVLKFKPADFDFGIKFKRIDLKDQPLIPALYSSVINTKMSTLVGTSAENSVSTIEHLMAALWAYGVDNCEIEIESVEIPIMDGGSSAFIEEFKKIGLVDQGVARKYLKIKKEVSFSDERATVKFLPLKEGFEIKTYINFERKMVGEQQFESKIDGRIFEKEVGPARTHGHVDDHEKLKSMGLAKGASLDNLLVYDDESILSTEKLRFVNEVVRHTTLDAIGDLYTSGYFIIGRYETSKGGHYYNNMVLRKLFEDPSNYEIV